MAFSYSLNMQHMSLSFLRSRLLSSSPSATASRPPQFIPCCLTSDMKLLTISTKEFFSSKPLYISRFSFCLSMMPVSSICLPYLSMRTLPSLPVALSTLSPSLENPRISMSGSPLTFICLNALRSASSVYWSGTMTNEPGVMFSNMNFSLSVLSLA